MAGHVHQGTHGLLKLHKGEMEGGGCVERNPNSSCFPEHVRNTQQNKNNNNKNYPPPVSKHEEGSS